MVKLFAEKGPFPELLQIGLLTRYRGESKLYKWISEVGQMTWSLCLLVSLKWLQDMSDFCSTHCWIKQLLIQMVKNLWAKVEKILFLWSIMYRKETQLYSVLSCPVLHSGQSCLTPATEDGRVVNDFHRTLLQVLLQAKKEGHFSQGDNFSLQVSQTWYLTP